jgi:8-oxo-dGTP pyrophosphatase MutT (NUDIX family)
MIITCGIYLYSTIEQKLLLCHPTNSRWNNWSIAKGLPEAGEDNITCAVRELREETGIDLSNINILKSLALPSRKYQKQNKVLESFLIITDTDLSKHKFTSNLVEGKDFNENDKWKWVSIEDCRGMIHETQQQNLEVIEKLVNG